MNQKVWFFDDFQTGHAFAPFQYSISAAEHAQFIALFGHEGIQAKRINERARDAPQEKPGMARPIHPVLVGNFQVQRAAFTWPQGVLHARENMRMHAPVYADEALQARVTVKDKYVKNGKRFVVLEITIRQQQDDSLVMTITRSQVWPQ